MKKAGDWNEYTSRNRGWKVIERIEKFQLEVEWQGVSVGQRDGCWVFLAELVLAL